MSMRLGRVGTKRLGRERRQKARVARGLMRGDGVGARSGAGQGSETE